MDVYDSLFLGLLLVFHNHFRFLVARSLKESYQCDALSSMMTITKDYFTSMKRFRLEWEIGEHGYVHW